jgi:acyl carrier protein
VQGWLINWFVARAKIGKATLQTPDSLSNADYFATGWLTSMEVVEFVTEIEEHFGMQFTDRDLQDSRFVTIAGLTELILERSTQAGGSG